jgi:hypothetical protein
MAEWRSYISIIFYPLEILVLADGKKKLYEFLQCLIRKRRIWNLEGTLKSGIWPYGHTRPSLSYYFIFNILFFISLSRHVFDFSVST